MARVAASGRVTALGRSLAPVRTAVPQAQNLIPYDCALNSWTASHATPTAKSVANPYGLAQVYSVVPDTVSATHYLSLPASRGGLGTWTVSFYAKADGYSWIRAQANITGGSFGAVWFDVSNGAVGTDAGSAPALTPTIKPTAFPGWYLCCTSFVNNAVDGGITAFLVPGNVDNAGNYPGDGTKGVLVCGVQISHTNVRGPDIRTTGTAYDVGDMRASL